MKILKILNNNAVVCSDGIVEKVVMGKGLAFQQKIGFDVDEAKVEKVFVLKNNNTDNRFLRFIENISMEDFFLAEDIISHAKKISSKEFDDSIYITLSDHLTGTFERIKNNIEITNPLASAIKGFYPEEFKIGQDAVKIIKEKRGVSLSLDEIAFITMHFVTAELGSENPEFNKILVFIQDIGNYIQTYLEKEIDDTSSVWQRFLTHLSFFAQRIMTGEETPKEELVLFDSISKSFPEAYKCVEDLSNYIHDRYSFDIGEYEKTYLIIHVNRLQIEFGIKDA